MEDSSTNIEQILYDYLVEVNLLDQFIHNHEHFPLKGVELTRTPEGIFGSAFSFTASPEGYNFWSDEYQKWKTYLRNQ